MDVCMLTLLLQKTSMTIYSVSVLWCIIMLVLFVLSFLKNEVRQVTEKSFTIDVIDTQLNEWHRGLCTLVFSLVL